MATVFSNDGKNSLLDGLAADAGFASLHTASPGTTGTNEVTGGSPAYARKSVTWAAASAGALTSTNAQVFDVPAGTTIAYVGLWSASTAGTFYGHVTITSESFTGQGTYTIAAGDIDFTVA
jgi:hypothetical protein